MSSVSILSTRTFCAIDHPVIFFRGSRGSSPSPLSHIAWKCAPTRDPVNALHRAPSFFHWTSTEIALSTNISPTRGLSRLRFAPSIPGISAAMALQSCPSTPPRLHGRSLRWLPPNVPADAHVVARWASWIAHAITRHHPRHPRHPNCNRRSTNTRSSNRYANAAARYGATPTCRNALFTSIF